MRPAVARIGTGVASQTWPYTYFTAAADCSPAPPLDDVQCFLDAIVVRSWPGSIVLKMQMLLPSTYVVRIAGARRRA
jgi:hypothetical protein